MESFFGRALSEARVHTGEEADAEAARWGARGIARGRDVFLGASFSPSTTEGGALLAHELTHVIQAETASREPRAPATPVAALESEAREVARAWRRGERAPAILGAARNLAAPLRDDPKQIPDTAKTTPDPGAPTVGNIPQDAPDLTGSRRVVLRRSGDKWVEFAAGRSPQVRTAAGSYDFVIQDGTIYAVKSNRFGHTEAARGLRVTWAGVIEFTKKGEIRVWTNESGHYLPAGGFSGNATTAHPDLPADKYVQKYKGAGGEGRGPQLPVFQEPPGSIVQKSPDYKPPKDTKDTGNTQPDATGSSTGTTAAKTGTTATTTTTGTTTTTTTTKSNEPVARVGTPLAPVVEGGPSPKGQAIGGGVVLGAQFKDWVMGMLVESHQNERLREAMERKAVGIQSWQEAHPELGAYITVYWKVHRGNEGEQIRIFEDISVRYGTTEKEARESNVASLLNVTATGRDSETSVTWIPPIQPLSLADLPSPRPRIAIATFARGKARLQGVQWKGVSGFDTWGRGSTSLEIPDNTRPLFAVLLPPSTVHWRNGQMRMSTDIGIVRAETANGYTIPVVSDAGATLVYPLDGATARILGQGRGMKDNLGQVRDQFEMTRWVPADAIEIETILDASEVAKVPPRPPTKEQLVGQRIGFLVDPQRTLLERLRPVRGTGLEWTPEGLDRFAQIVPLDLTDAEIERLTKYRGSTAGKDLSAVLDDLEKAIARLPGRSASVGEKGAGSQTATGTTPTGTAATVTTTTGAGGGPAGPALTADAAAIREKLGAVDWKKLPVAGIYFRDAAPIGLTPGTKTRSFAYGFNEAGRKYGGMVEIEVGEPEKDSTPVKVLSSSDMIDADGTFYAPAARVVGRTFQLKTLEKLAAGSKVKAARSR